MDKEILAKIKGILDAEQQRLETALAEFTKRDASITDNYRSDFPQYGNKDDENAAEVAEYSDRLSLEHLLEKQLRDVHKALAGMANGTYGVCVHCSKPIEEQRLLARPTSTSCVDCKKKLTGEE